MCYVCVYRVLERVIYVDCWQNPWTMEMKGNFKKKVLFLVLMTVKATLYSKGESKYYNNKKVQFWYTTLLPLKQWVNISFF